MNYGASQYGLLIFGADEVPEEEMDPYLPDLMLYLPDYYQGIQEMRELQEALSHQIGYLNYSAASVLDQCFVTTATWGLSIWEQEFGLATDLSGTYIRRREIIRSKIRGTGTTTKQMIRTAAAAFSGGDVDVIEYPAENRFVVKFIGILGIPPNMAGFIQMLETIKPAHLTYSFDYTYTVWGNLKSSAWADLSSRTWGDLQTYEREE